MILDRSWYPSSYLIRLLSYGNLYFSIYDINDKKWYYAYLFYGLSNLINFYRY